MIAIEAETATAGEAERIVAGCVLIGPEEVDDARALVGPDDFAGYAYRLVFVAACELRDAGRPVDAGAVLLRLQETGRAADLGHDPHGFLAGLVMTAPTAANLSYAGQQVREAAARRALARVGTELIRDAAAPGEPADELAARFEQRLRDAVGDRAGGRGPVPLAAALATAAHRYDENQRGRRTRPAITTGVPELDRLTGGGFAPGQLVIVGARPSHGKTALAERFAAAAGRAGHGVLVVSLEMDEPEVTDRFVAAEARVHLTRLRGAAPLDADQSARVGDQLRRDRLGGLPVWIDDRPGQTAAGIAATARRLARREGVKLVVIDYLQLVEPENRRDPRYLQVGLVAKRLKDLARRAGVAVVAMAQLNREVESRGDGQPRLSDLRDSGELEQDGDIVLLLHKLDDDNLAPVHRVDLLLCKNRNGPTGVVPLDFHRPFTRFEQRHPAA